MNNRKLLKSTGVIGISTTISRILGFVRDILFANFFGTNMFAQAFVVAFRLPNMLRHMVGEGAADSAIVPILTEYKHTKTVEEYWEASRVILCFMFVFLLIFSVIGVFFAPLLVKVIAPGFLASNEKFLLTVSLTKMMFPYILFIGLVSYCKGVLNSLNYFFTPAFSPVVLNISMIFSLLVFCHIFGIKGMVFGVIIGGILELGIQILPLYKKGFRLIKLNSFYHPVIKRIGKLILPRAIGTAVYQLSILMDTVLASLTWIVGSGGVAALYYSNRLVQLPLAIFGISLATAVLPNMSKSFAQKKIHDFKNTILFSLKTVFAIMIPSTIGFLILSKFIIQLLFQRGEFTNYSTNITSNALFFYSLGLFAYAGIKILVSAYYAMSDTKTPLKTAFVSLLLNLFLNLLLMWPLKVGGLACATSIAAMMNLFFLYYFLTKKIGDIGLFSIIFCFLKICLASFLMGCITMYFSIVLLNDTFSLDVFCLFKFCFVILLSILSYLFFCYILNIEVIKKIIQEIMIKIKKTKNVAI